MKQKVIVGWPDGGNVTGAFTLSMIELFRFELMNPSEDYEVLQPLRRSSLYIQNNRNDLVDDAKTLGADWLLQIDGDHSFAPNLLRRLMETADRFARPIIAGLYSNIGSTGDGQSVEVIDCVYGEVENGQYKALTIPDNEDPFACDAVGAGILLTHMSVFEQLSFPWFWVDLFQDPKKKRPQPMNEDIVFCRYARDNGIPIHCDPRPDITHWKSVPLTPSTMRKFLTKAWAVQEKMKKESYEPFFDKK